VIEYYTDAYGLDAENNVSNFRAAHPSADGLYDQGDGAWHNMVPAWRAEAAGEAAFTDDKADSLEVEHLSFIAGPTLDILKAQLDAAEVEGFIPYEPTMGQYITAEEAAARYANLQEWYRRYGHFWISMGPLFLQKAFPVEGTVILQRNPDYPDLATRWDRFAEAPVPEVTMDGPGNVTIGEEATFDVFVEFAGEPYIPAEIALTKFLVFDAKGDLALVGEPTVVADGHWQVVLSADVTGALDAGANQLAAIVVSNRALVPIFETITFVTQ
jgi:peptide/nickel transport system substrate-binding protein